jgi:hypothetical protein
MFMFPPIVAMPPSALPVTVAVPIMIAVVGSGVNVMMGIAVALAVIGGIRVSSVKGAAVAVTIATVYFTSGGEQQHPRANQSNELFHFTDPPLKSWHSTQGKTMGINPSRARLRRDLPYCSAGR